MDYPGAHFERRVAENEREQLETGEEDRKVREKVDERADKDLGGDGEGEGEK
jgi:hypothetical protein